jgi:hypothetical protein
MKNFFNNNAQKSEAEQFLDTEEIAYEKRPDGTLHVRGDISLANRGLTELPDLSNVHVEGRFNCSCNRLTSLKGTPHSVGGSFLCAENQLISLRGVPQSVGGIFECTLNRLTSLEDAPHSVGGNFFCSLNPLASLEGAPQQFKLLVSDHGVYSSWQEVPEGLRYSPETRARMEKEAADAAALEEAQLALQRSPALQRALPAPKPLVPKK